MAVYRMGSKGPQVSAIQRKFQALGYSLDADGIFGRRTRDVVTTFQAAQGLAVDGEVGPNTMAALDGARPTVKPPDPKDGDYTYAEVLRRNPNLAAPQAAVLRRALDFLGARELYGTNSGPEIEPMVGGWAAHVGVDPGSPAPPWCAIFASSAIKQGLRKRDWNDTPMREWLPSAHAYEQWAKRVGAWEETPEPGAVAVIKYKDRPAGGYDGHVGLVCWVDAMGRITTVDGNVTDAVGLRTRAPADIRGYVYWWRAL